MRTIHRAAVLAAGALVIVAAPGLSRAALPRNSHDPCGSRGRDSCHTTGVGFYRTSAYGVRWYGDFKGAVPGQAHLFCIDLRFWYASPAYRYRPVSAAGLRNRDGALVTADRRRRIAYAVWKFGRSGSPAKQAAVMLYVHSQMGDGRPAELDPAAAGTSIATLFSRISNAADRFAGPYRIEARLPAKLTVGDAATATIRLLSASGAPLGGVPLAVSATGATSARPQVRTDQRGLARVAVTPTSVSGLRLRVRTGQVASTEPAIFAPTAGQARQNGQRLAAPASQRVTSTYSRTDVVAVPRLTAHVIPSSVAVGSIVADSVAVKDLGDGSATVQVQLWGPFASAAEISCSNGPMWSGSFVSAGDSTRTTAAVRLNRAGYYGYRAWLAGKDSDASASTACGSAVQTTVAVARPALTTAISTRVVRPGRAVFDQITVRGLGQTPASIDAQLYGPFGSRADIRCDTAHLVWSGQVAAAGDGQVRTPSAPLARPGFYGYREEIAAAPLVATMATPCAPIEETALVAPEIVTGGRNVSAYRAALGAGPSRPTRVRIDSLGIDVPVAASGIDVAHGVLGIPANIHSAGWWRDGAPPGASAGTILVAGHVDNAKGGLGAFFPLKRARTGDLVELTTAAGRTFAYRIVSVRVFPKSALPTAVFSTTGKPELVLVTCGGRFDSATGHYPDNVVVTAVPVS